MADAAAQSAVTVFGTLDVTAESVRGGGVSGERVSSNSSGFGFRGSEALSPGLNAIYQIEGGMNVDTGAGALNTRDTFVGLSGTLGTVRMGLMTSPLRALGGYLNFIPGGTSMANNMGVMSTLNGLHAGLNSRLANSVQYAFPAWHGVNGALVYAPGESRPGGFNDRSWGASLNYGGKGLYLGWAYESRHAQHKLALGDSNDFENRLVARYAKGEWTVNLGWDRLGSKGLFSGLGGAVERDAFTAGLMFKRAAHDVMLHLSMARDLDCSGNARTGQCAAAAVGHTGARQVSLLYHYIFSKRTMLITSYSAIKNDASAVYDFDANPLVASLSARKLGASLRGLSIGIRHSF
jgi:predicted porin